MSRGNPMNFEGVCDIVPNAVEVTTDPGVCLRS